MTTSPLDHVAEIAAWMKAAGIDRLELDGPHGRLHLGRDTADRGGVPTGTGLAAEEPETVTSPGVGVFLHRHPLREEPLAQPDEPVSAGAPLGLLRIGSLLVPVLAPWAGTVADTIAPDGTLVGYGDPLVSLWRTPAAAPDNE